MDGKVAAQDEFGSLRAGVRAQLDAGLRGWSAVVPHLPAVEILPAAPDLVARDDVPISRIAAFLSAPERAYLIESAAGRLRRSRVGADVASSALRLGARYSLGCYLDREGEAGLYSALARRLGVATSEINTANIICYRRGGYFHDHVDASTGEWARRSTGIVFLNDGYEGGALAFPRLGLTFPGEPGELILFDNFKADGLVNDSAAHAGAQVTKGEKWVLVFWSSVPLAARAAEAAEGIVREQG